MRGWQGPTALVLLVLLHELHAQNYQLNFQRGNDDLNDITLSCSKDGYSFSAAFWSRPTEDGSAVSIHNGTGYQFILTQQLEAYYCCGELSNVEPDSDCKPLLVIPTSLVVNHKDFYEIQLGTVFTSLDCGIRPGALSEFYQLSWVRHLTTLSSNVNTGNFSLSIVDAGERDGDRYYCTVTVQGYTRTQEITVLIYSLPKISPNDDLSVTAVTTDQLPDYTLNCSIYAHTREPQSEALSWRYNGREVTDGGNYRVTNSNLQSSLTILGAGMEDSGEYECCMVVTVGDVGNEKETRNVSYTASTSVAFLSDEFQVTRADSIPGEKFEICLRHIPASIYDHVRFRTRFTEANNSVSQPFDLVVAPPVAFPSTTCFQVAKEDIVVPYHTVKVQVAVELGDARSPFVPELSAARILVLRIPSPTDEEANTSSDSASLSNMEIISIGIAAVIIVGLVILLILAVIFFRYRCRKEAKKKLNKKLEGRIVKEEEALEKERDPQVRLERVRNIGRMEDRIQTEGPEEGDEEEGDEGSPEQEDEPSTPEVIKRDLEGVAADESQGNQEDRDRYVEDHETSLDSKS